MDLEHSTIKINAVHLHMVQAGTKSGTPVLLLHGLRFGMVKHHPQKGLVLTKRFIISPLQIAENG